MTRDSERGWQGVLDRIEGIDAPDAARDVGAGIESPESGESDDLGGVATHDGWRCLAKRGKDFCPQISDADPDGIEDPRFAERLEFASGGGERLRIELEKGPRVDVERPRGARHGDAFVGKIHHCGRAASRELSVGDEVDGDGVGDGRGHRHFSAHTARGFRDGGTDLG